MHTNSIYFICDIFFLFALFYDLYLGIIIDALISLKVTKKSCKKEIWGETAVFDDSNNTIPSKELESDPNL